MSARSPLEGFAILDVAVTTHVRVRVWHHRFGPTSFAPRTHPHVEVAWVLEGEVTYGLADGDLLVRAGEGAVIPAGVEHGTSVTPGTRAGSAWLSAERFAEIAAAVGREPSRAPLILGDAGPLAAVGALLAAEARESRPGRLVAAGALAEALAVAVLRAHGPAPRAHDPRIARALSRIESDYAEELGVDELARAAGMSRFHFSRAFRAELGLSPYRYLQRVRIARARELLDGGHRVTEAALSVGFRDLGRFARAFRAETGITPSAARPRRRRPSEAHESPYAPHEARRRCDDGPAA